MPQNSPGVRRSRGASIALILACVIGLVGLLGFFVFNYSRIFGSQREAQTAIDAATLEAAKQASNVYVTSDLGFIGLVDQGPDSSTSRPSIEGINTALATARLDALIAGDLGNSSMQVLAARDITDLQSNVLPALTKAVQAKLADPATVQAVQNVYLSNANRDYRNKDGNATLINSMQISYGSFNNQNVATNIRTPNGVDNAVNGGNSVGSMPNRYYKANVAIQTPGTQNVTFGAVGDTPRIVDNGEFNPTPSGGVIPTAVQVQVTSHLAGNGATSNTNLDQKLTNIATSLCGSDIVTNTSTTYCISFPSGFPPDPNFHSAAALMATASLSSATNAPSTTDSAFTNLPTQTWFRSPPNGTIPPGPMIGGSQGGFSVGPSQTRTQDYPPVALAFGLYDWVRSMGLRIERTSMVAALSADMSAFVNSGNYSTPIKFTWDGTTPAYASGGTPQQQNSAWMSVPSNPNQDPRYLAVTNMGSDPNGVRNIINAFGYEFPGNVTPPHAAATMVTQTGVTTTDGQDIKELGDAQNAIFRTNHAAECVKLAGQQVAAAMSAKAQSLQAAANAASQQAASDNAQIATLQGQNPVPQSQISALQADAAAQTQQATTDSQQAQAAQATANLATVCSANGGHVQDQTYAMMTNLQALTGLGCNEVDASHFTIASSTFTADQQAAGDTNFMDHPTAQQVQAMATAISNATGPSDNGLSTGSGGTWAASDSSTPPKPNLSSYTHTGAPVTIAHRQPGKGDLFTQPANAQLPNAPGQAIPPFNNLMFLFNIAGDYQKQGSCTVTITPLPLSPFFNNTTSNGQAFYYAPGCLSTNTNGLQVSWTCTARDNAANGQYFTPSSESNNAASGNANYCQGGYNMSMNTSGGNSCPTLGGEFRVGCPIPGGCVGSATITNNGTLSVTPCPPPPPHMG